MKALTTSAEINRELIRLIRECSSCKIAVAWASAGFPAFDELWKQHRKIKRMVVGTHFYQTDPDFIARFREHNGVRFVLNTGGVFHPKVYLFEHKGGHRECVVGSPNFTVGGLGRNEDLALLISEPGDNAGSVIEEVRDAIDRY